MEPRQGPLGGAAGDREGLRGEVRPPAGRPLPARHDLPALADRQASRGVPLRPARGHASGRAGRDIPAGAEVAVHPRDVCDVPEGTLLTVVESGFDQIPLARRAEAWRKNDEGWAIQMENIERHVAG